MVGSKPSIEQLRKVCQDRPDKHDFYMWGVARKISIYFTWLFVRTPITANQITAISIIFGFLGTTLFTLPAPVFWIFGWLVANGYFILDQVDGEVARFRKRVTPFGYFFDEVSHPVVNSALFLAATAGIYKYSGNASTLAAGLYVMFFISVLRFVNAYADFATNNMFKLKRQKIEMPKNLVRRIAGIPFGLGGYFHMFTAAAVLDMFFTLNINYMGLTILSFRELFLWLLVIAMPTVSIMKTLKLRETLKDSSL